MYKFLDVISREAICRYINISFPSIKKNILDELDRKAIYGILYTLHGYDLLYEKKIRRLLAESLGEERIKKFAIELGINKKEKIFDLALSISNLPWRFGCKSIWVYANYFSIPLEYLPAKQKRIDAIEVIEPFSPPPSLFDYQKSLSSSLKQFLLNPSEYNYVCLLQLPTGAGKTRTVIDALVDFCNQRYHADKRVSILWLAHTEELCEQAIESFRRTWQAMGEYENRAVRFWGDFRCPLEEMTFSFVVAGFKKVTQLAEKNYDKFAKFFEKIDVILIDEAHKALAPSIKSIVENWKNKKRICLVGLTATPGRSVSDIKENKKLANLFNKNLLFSTELGSDPISTLQHRGILSKIDIRTLRTNINYDLSQGEREKVKLSGDLPSLVLRKLARNRKRNEIIVEQVIQHIELGNPILIFACTVDHSKELAVKVAARGYKAAAIDCRMRRSLRRHVINDFKNGTVNALFNFGVLSTGFDAPNIKTVLIARPTTSIVLYSQMIGRGLRGAQVGGSERCILVDMKDNFENFGNVEDVYSFFNEFWKT